MITPCTNETHNFKVLKITSKWTTFICKYCNNKEVVYLPDPTNVYHIKNPN